MIKNILKKIIYRNKYNSNTYIKYLNNIGANVSKNAYIVSPTKTLIDVTRPYLIEIQDFVTITEGCTILTHGFDWSVLKIKYSEIIGSAGKVTIKRNTFIGANTTILKGVTIGENCIIGAGSIVTKDIPDNSVAVGNPCKVISTIDEYYNKRKKQELEEAKELIKEYYRKYKKTPNPDELAEFLWLFATDKEIDSNSIFKRKLSYGNNYSSCIENMQNRVKIFDYEDLCREALKDEL